MRTLFDTSALLPALHEPHEFHQRALPWLQMAQQGEIHGIISTHTLAELYGKMSIIRPLMNALHIMELISHNILPVFETIPLDADDYRAMLERFASLDIRGGTIYDGLIAHAAVKGSAEQILTFNESDFHRVSAGLPLQIVVP